MKRSILTLTLAVTLATPAWAATESREKQMLRRMQQQVQQLDQARLQAEQDKAAALAGNDKLIVEVEHLRGAAATAKRERIARTRSEHQLSVVQTELDALKTRLAGLEQQLADSQAQQRAVATLLSQTETARKQAEERLANAQQDIRQFREHNGQLYALGRDMLEKYRNKSCQDALAQAEPFIGLKRVEVENLLEQWRDRLDRERAPPTP